MSAPIRVGTRRSPLARAQTAEVIDRLHAVHPEARFIEHPMFTSGDRRRNPSPTPDFTDAIDRALADGSIDLAVHSAKDLPSAASPRLSTVAYPAREDPRDCLVFARRAHDRTLPKRAKVGSSSLRRRGQLLRWRPDLTVVEIHGNIGTRLAQLEERPLDALVLAVAGLRRLGLSSRVGLPLSVRRALPAPGQGALCVEARSSDRGLARMARAIDDPRTRAEVTAERALSAALGGDCNLPLGALARCTGSHLTLTAEVLSSDGRTRLRERAVGPTEGPARLAHRLARRLRAEGAVDLVTRSAP